MQRGRRISWYGWTLAAVFVCAACRPATFPEEAVESPTPIEDEQLVLRNATLEQADDQGKALWKINAQLTRYSENQRAATLKGLTGNLLEEGQVILKVRAAGGEIRLEEDGEKIFLRGTIEATDPRNELTIRAEELDWLPREHRASARGKLQASHPELEIVAREVRYETRKQQLEAIGKVLVVAKEQPLQLQSEQLTWRIGDRQLSSDSGIDLRRYQAPKTLSAVNATSRGARLGLNLGAGQPLLLAPPPLPETATDRVVAQKAQLNLDTLIATLQEAVESRSLEPPLQIASNSIVWNLQKRTVLSDQPVEILHTSDRVAIAANRGFADLEAETVQLSGGARGRNPRNQSELSAEEILWQINDRLVEAEGLVIYRQTDPPLHLVGSRAVGNLDQQNVTITGGGRERVVTNIVPD